MTTAQNLQFRARLQLRYLETAGADARPARPTRLPAARAQYAARPADYAEDILGLTIRWYIGGRCYDQLLKLLDLFLTEPFMIVPGGNGLMKSFALAILSIWNHDAVGAQLDEQGREMGSRTLLLGPTETQVYQNLYSKILAMAKGAEDLGHAMPPGRQERTPRWMPREEYCMEAITPGVQVGNHLSHRASGRHHVNLLACVEEAQGVHSGVVQSIIGSASGGGPGVMPGGRFERNSVWAILNADRVDSAIATEARKSTWRVWHLSAMDHPNVVARRRIVPGGAVSHAFVDRQVAGSCRRVGAFPAVLPDPTHREFVYALPEEIGVEGGGPREDGYPGHEDAELAVYRPDALFEARVLGLFPRRGDADLFDVDAWDAAVERWKRHRDPDRAPDAVGVDTAREGMDDSVAAPRWGEDAYALLARWAEILAGKAPDAKAQLAQLAGSVRIGELYTAPKGDGPTVSRAIYSRSRWGTARCWLVDDGGNNGGSVIDSARQLGVTVYPVSFGGKAPAPVEGQIWAADTVRDALHALFASVLNRGWVDVPPDPRLREEAMACWAIAKGQREYEVKERTATGGIRTVKRTISTRGLPPKDEIKKLIGRSPDGLDAVVCSLYRGKVAARGGAIPLPEIFY